MKHLYLFGLLLSLPFFGSSQGEWNNWNFGWNAAIKFISGTPVGITGSALFQSGDGTTTNVSDSTGQLLFYANGSTIWNRNNTVMPNGNGIIGGNACQQPVFSVPVPGFPSKYYVFTVGDLMHTSNPLVGLHYSIVDMSLQGGLGDVASSQKNVFVPWGDSAVDQLTATRGHNNKDIWILVRKHRPITNYLAYHIDESGLNTTPVVSPTNLPARFRWQFGQLNTQRGGDMKISYDGKFLVCHDSLTEICRFNDTTGIVTPLFIIYIDFQMSGIEFSIDSKYLYVCRAGGNVNQCSYGAYQFDLSYLDSSSFIQHKVQVGCGAGGKLQMGPDWKVYVGANPAIDSLNCINNPSLPGLACNYQRNAVKLLGNENNSCLVQFLQRYKVYLNYTGECQWDSVHFSSDIWPPADSIRWNFGDPISGGFNTSDHLNPSHIYSNPGTYTVELYVRHIDNRRDTSWQTITILDSPHPALGQDRSICTGDSVMLDAGYWMNSTYSWDNLTLGLMNIATTQTYYAKTTGDFRVTVTNTEGCSGKDTVSVTVNPIPDVTNSPLSKTICSGESTNIALTSSIPGTNFHWTASLTSGNISGFSADSGLVINQILTNTLATPGIVTYQITPKIGSCSGSTVNFPVTVNPGIPVTISITESQNNVCAGTLVTFNALPTNQGSTPTYLWKVNDINQPGNLQTFSYTPANNDVVTCVLTSSNTVCTSNNPATSNPITMTVNTNMPVSITLTSAPATICAGQQVTFTAHPINEGTTPTYQWYLNSNPVGSNSNTYTFTPVNGDIVYCTLTSSETCTTNNPASSIQHQVSVSPLVPVSITITASQNPFCAGSSVTFNATPNGGGLTPSFQWKVNGVNVGGGTSVFTYAPAAGDIVCCVLNSSLACTSGNPATSNCITMIVDTGLPAGINISSSVNPFCPGSSVTFTATPSNGGSTPAYQWKVNGNNVGINSSTYTYNPVNNDSIRCVMTSNLSCVTGNPVSSVKIFMNGTLAPIVTFTSCFDTITTINAKPIKLKGGIPLGGTYSGPGVNSLTGTYTPSLAGIGTHTITYSYTNAALCSAAKSISILNLPSSILTCGNPLTDVRDNKIYQTVQIGAQCWLASNLNFGSVLASSQDQRDNCVAEKYCYNDNPLNCTNQGGLYQWDEVMRFDETPADQGFCPPGWHNPTENEWNTLFANYINSGFAGSPLKYSGYSGFNALLSGARHINKGWDFQGFATFFWSSTAISDNKAWAHGMNDPDPSVSLYPASRVNAFSVRCLKD